MSTELHQRVSVNEADIKNLERWQRSQNGTIYRVEDKIDKLLVGVLLTSIAAIGSLVMLILSSLGGG